MKVSPVPQHDRQDVEERNVRKKSLQRSEVTAAPRWNSDTHTVSWSQLVTDQTNNRHVSRNVYFCSVSGT